jgi:hypothetical protein
LNLPAAAVAPATLVPIPVAKIAPSATQVAQTLRHLATELTPGDDVQAIREALPATSAQLGKDLERALSLLQGPAFVGGTSNHRVAARDCSGAR